ncbi:hypothetical protein ABZ686_13730 [Streptomyces sp. NPDC006992]|uniref:hypothetical protein n=1 Tax=Streptomyces sp. NPDC006992 TaxID=3155601 RepID=UPI0033EAD70A
MATESTRTTQNTTDRSPDEEPADEAAAAEQRSPAAEEKGGRGPQRDGKKSQQEAQEDAALPTAAGAGDGKEPDATADAPDSDTDRDDLGGGDDGGNGDDGGDGDPQAADSASGRRQDWAGGAVAVLSAGLGLASLTGTSISDMLRERKSLIGQIESSAQGSGGSASDQVNALYGAPWHAAAVVNGIFAVLAVAVGALLLAALTGRSRARGWVKAVALGGVLLGLVGLLVAGGMYFDLFAAQPEVPAAPGQ